MSSSELLTIRYPSGVTEYRLRDGTPRAGEALVYDDRCWVVERVAEAADRRLVVILRAHVALVDPIPEVDPSSRRESEDRVAMHERAARLHDAAAELQARHVEEMTAANERAKAARARRLARKERELAEHHRAMAARHRPEP